MNILITGGAGYIGSHVVKQLLETTFHTLTVIDNLSTGNQKTINTLQHIALEVQKGTLQFHHVDLSDFHSLEKIFSTGHFDAIIHFAASTCVSESVANPLKYYMNNTFNTANLIRLSHQYKVNNFIFSSTAAVYGNPIQIPVEETAATHPINPYGMSKLMSEQILKDAAKANPDFRYIVLRYFNVAGADLNNRIGPSLPDATHLIKIAVQTALGKRDRMHIYGEDYNTFDGTCIRDYIHVNDLASVHIQALEYLSNGSQSGVFNCGYGHGYSVKEVIDTVKTISHSDFIVKISPRRAGDPAQIISDNSKVKNILGWKPQYDDLSLICSTALAWEKTL